jgi:hypothetical protein
MFAVHFYGPGKEAFSCSIWGGVLCVNEKPLKNTLKNLIDSLCNYAGTEFKLVILFDI